MRTLYLDCGMGAAGDMLTAALLELLPDPDGFLEKLNALGIPDAEVKRERAVKCGITGTHVSVIVGGAEESADMWEHDHEHGHEHGHSHEEGYDHRSHECCEGAQSHAHHEDGHSHENIHEHGEEHDHHSHECCEGAQSHAHHEHGHSHEHEHEHGHDPIHAHHHSGMQEIEHIISGFRIPEKIREDILSVYRLIAEAESHVHGVPVTDIHFHEVGTMDAIADITAVCMLMNEIAPDEVVVSPVHVGSGQVRCAHGILPVPAPATAFILRDVPMYGGNIEGELCTPTGAALLRHFAARFGDMPVMRTQGIGYGMGKKDFPRANCVRAMLGETEDRSDTVLELSCNVDDMTAEAVGFAMERLFEAGAKEVYTIPIGMKKSRPGTLIRVMCSQEDREKMLALLFGHTTTIGVREAMAHRYVLERNMEILHTPYGEVRRKVSSGYGVLRSKYEYDDLARIARERNISLDEVKKILDDIT